MTAPGASPLLFLVGGARSGKSRLAQELAAGTGRHVVYVATATAGDDDMAARIRRHQDDRPAHWGLVECPIALTDAVDAIDKDCTVIVDCLTMWVANLVFDPTDHDIEAEAAEAADRLAGRPGPSIVVSNEVGLGVHPPTDLGRRYQDVLGRVNQIVASRAGEALFLVAGRATRLHRPAELLGRWPPPGS